MDIEPQVHNDVSDGSKTVEEFNSQDSKVKLKKLYFAFIRLITIY